MRRNRNRVSMTTIIEGSPKRTYSERPTEDDMICERCGGLTVATQFEGGHAWVCDGWERLSYGNITDQLIMTNRAAQAHEAIGLMTSSRMRSAHGAVSPRHTNTVQRRVEPDKRIVTYKGRMWNRLS